MPLRTVFANPVTYISTHFDKHFNSYEAELLDDEKVICQYKDLADYHLLSLSKSFDRAMYDKNFICKKYYVFEKLSCTKSWMKLIEYIILYYKDYKYN